MYTDGCGFGQGCDTIVRKQETLRCARNRGLAFLCALLLAAASYKLLDYTLLAFAVYLFCFALLCLAAGWTEALAIDSVLISHFLTDKSFHVAMVGNEIGLFLIGTIVGVLVNLYLRRQETVFLELSGEADEQLKGILRRMAEWLLREDKTGYGPECFDRLQELDELFDSLKGEEMPTAREEFEARAILFYILKQLEKLLMIKREFI